MAKITIDNRELEVRDGSMIIEAADEAGIYIPRFCYHEKLSIAANCRMCLVEVEKAPKPLPACATPVADGMIVKTQSELAVEAQKGTMEFLLINHPLDCPVCDQGGECPLQDQALGYGKDVSRFTEKKRVVDDKDIGPLIATEMTRCIHCTRCVRFGQEIGGIMEMGALGRGEYMEIATFIGESIDSEVSGNMIDLCPVGALTSKPYRFSARVWELADTATVSPHDCVGTNINVQSVRGEVKRVLPRLNEAVNQDWLADRDRYAYDALDDDDRLTQPMVRRGSQWVEVSWQQALETAANGLRETISEHGARSVSALASPTATLEEFYLLQQLMRSVGSDNVDHRLRQGDFSDDDIAPKQYGLGRSIASLNDLDALLLVGSNIRKEQPLLGVRVRQAALNGALVNSISSIDYDFHFPLNAKRVVRPDLVPTVLAALAAKLAETANLSLPEEIAAICAKADQSQVAEDDISRMASALSDAGNAAVIIGAGAMGHADGAAVRAIGAWIAKSSDASFGIMPEANASAAWLAGCVPHRSATGSVSTPGKHALAHANETTNGFLTINVEPNEDCINGADLALALHAARFNVALTIWRSSAESWAHVMLPIAAYTETEGTYVNCENRLQKGKAVVKPAGESRPGWKVLRVLGNQLKLDGFDYIDAQQVVDAAMRNNPLADSIGIDDDLGDVESIVFDVWRLNAPSMDTVDDALVPVCDVPLYRTDSIVRRCMPLQATRDNIAPGVYLNEATAKQWGFAAGMTVEVTRAGVNGSQVWPLAVYVDNRVSEGSAYLPGGWSATAIGNYPLRLRAADVGVAAG